MEISDDISPVLAAFGVSPRQIQSLGNAGGFSGARFWRMETSSGLFCLRRWPQAHPSSQQLEWIHETLSRAAKQISFLPVPLRTAEGASFISHQDHLWEWTPWLPGKADYAEHPSNGKLENALAALARFHEAAKEEGGFRRFARSTGVAERSIKIKLLAENQAQSLRQSLRPEIWPEMAKCGEEFLALAPRAAQLLQEKLQAAAEQTLPLQVCLRDIWQDHVLFTGDEVTGLVDFGAMRIETVAGDIARLLGSLAPDDEHTWRIGIAAYEQVRPLSPEERNLLPVIDRANTILSGIHWLRWVFEAQHQFEDRSRVLQRFQLLLTRLRAASVME